MKKQNEELMAFDAFIYTNYSTMAFENHYLFLQVEPGKVFFVLWAWLYELEYMDTATEQTHHTNTSILHTCTMSTVEPK